MARSTGPDPKVAALRASRTLNPRPEAVSDPMFCASAFFDARDVVQVKYEMVRRVRIDGIPVAHAAAAFGFSRPSFYEAAAALDRDGLPGLVPAKPGPKRGHKLTDAVIDHIQTLRAADPGLRPADLAEALWQRFDIQVHPRSIERALARRVQGNPAPKRRRPAGRP